MEILNAILPVLLYIFGIILLIVLIILGIRMIQVLDKVDRIVDNVEEKVNSVNGFFEMLDKTSYGISMLGDKIINLVSGAISKIFNKNKKDEEDYIWVKKKKKLGIGKFIAGAAIGAGLGILFAPRKGSETRAALKAKMNELVAQIKNIDMEDVKEEFNKKVEEIKAGLADLDKEKVLEIAKEKAVQLKDKAQELVDLAIDKGTPVLRDAAEEVRLKAIDVTKEVLKKLEKEEEKK